MVLLKVLLRLSAVALLSGHSVVQGETDAIETSPATEGAAVAAGGAAAAGGGGGRETAGEVDQHRGEGGEDEDDVWAAAIILNTAGPSDLHLQNNTEILAQVGGEATFTCFTHHLSDEMVTWMKREDDQLLTVGPQVYAAENRFTATHSHHSKAWELWVKDIQLSDAGHYECQLTTHPPVTFFFTLKVTQAEAVVNGPNEVHIEEGSELALECQVRHAVAPPVYIFWYHNSTMVNYGKHELKVRHKNFTSSLVVTRVRFSDAGTYSCEPHLATPANVTVHVVTGKTPAAMQHGRNQVGGGSQPCPPSLTSMVVSLSLTCLLTFLPTLRPPSPIRREFN
ncbi:protein amalgam-like [Procambarus clarkii]|uniref:protein amalgam-like n=1 Tax=Procambarus clarkii TaxID=6728 RepID=UPI00374410C0